MNTTRYHFPRKPSTFRRGLLILIPTLPLVLLSVLVSLPGASSASPAATARQITVDPVADDNPGGGCTLREAIDAANAGTGAGTHANGCVVSESGSGTPVTYILTLPAYTYTLTGAADESDNASGDLDVKANLIIIGQGSANTIIDGNKDDRIFHINPLGEKALTVSITDVSLRNGSSLGGGAILNKDSALMISRSRIEKNFADIEGGGIYNSGGIIDMMDCVIADNYRPEKGGGIYNDYNGTLRIKRSIFSGNTASEDGGGIYTGGDLTITDSTFFDNKAEHGGGLFVYSAFADISGSTFYSNDVQFDGGGIYAERVDPLTITNSTISNNYAGRDGGGLFFDRSDASITNSTITDNHADDAWDGDGDGGGIYVEYDFEYSVSLKNTIIAKNYDGSPQGYDRERDCSGTFVSLDYNLIGDTTGCNMGGGAAHDLLNQDAKLGPLADNGGPTQTHMPLDDSPAINHIPNGANGCGSAPLNVDQRRVVRPVAASCEVGAVEIGYMIYLPLIMR